MPIKQFNPDIRNAFQRRMMALCKSMEEDFGVKIEENGYKYDGAGQYFEPKFRVSVLDETGEAYNPEVDCFAQLAESYGLLKSDLGKHFTSNGTTYEITGLKPSRRKFPISGKRVSDGKGFKFPKQTVQKGIMRSA